MTVHGDLAHFRAGSSPGSLDGVEGTYLAHLRALI